MTRYWISWYEPMEDGDYRPLTVPPKDAVIGWWCSGETLSEPPQATICAVIVADNEEEAKRTAYRYWRPSEWRFVNEKPDDWTPGSRFPIS